MSNKNKDEVLSLDEIKRRITSRLGIEEDELKTLYPTEAGVREFYTQEVLTLPEVNNVEADWDADDYQLPQSGQTELAAARLRKEAATKQKDDTLKFVKTERELLRRQDEFLPAEQSHLPVKQRVSLADIAHEALLLKDLDLEGGDDAPKKNS